MSPDPFNPDSSRGKSALPQGLTFGPFPVVVVAVTLASFMVWVAWVAPGGETPDWDSPLARWMVLRTEDFRVQAFLFHSLFYQYGLHLAATVVVLLYAGLRLEMRWGSIRFGVFYLSVTLLAAAISVFVDWIRGSPGSWIMGGAAVALASLTVLSVVEEDTLVLQLVSRKYLIWCILILGSTGLVLLDGSEDRLFLLPQISGILLGWLFTLVMPHGDRLLLLWELRRRRMEEERVTRIRNRVEELLEKISVDGIDSLSEEERAFLKQASKHYRRRV